MELKDKYETRHLIATTVSNDSRIAITVVSIVFPACHVFKSYSVDHFSFFQDGKKRNKEGKFDKDKKIPASHRIREKKVCHISIIFY